MEGDVAVADPISARIPVSVPGLVVSPLSANGVPHTQSYRQTRPRPMLPEFRFSYRLFDSLFTHLRYTTYFLLTYFN